MATLQVPAPGTTPEVAMSVSDPVIKENHLSYVSSLDSRRPESIDLAVIHCTELPDLPTARLYGDRIHYPESGTGNSGHFYLDRDGRIEEWVPVDRVAHHVRGYNEQSVGIELVNRGRYPDWLDSRKQAMPEPYPTAQITSLIWLLLFLNSKLAGLQWVAGHEELDATRVAATDDPNLTVFRKRDPGPLFPWSMVLQNIQLKTFLPD